MAETIVRQYRRCHCNTCGIHSETCHSRCKDYLRWKAEEDAVKAVIRKEKENRVFSNTAYARMIELIKARKNRT